VASRGFEEAEELTVESIGSSSIMARMEITSTMYTEKHVGITPHIVIKSDCSIRAFGAYLNTSLKFRVFFLPSLNATAI
jgi:hypothetical protein